jgi:hypothetical protein
MARGLQNQNNLERNDKKSTPSKNLEGRNTNSKQTRYKFNKNPKLAPIKYNSSTIDVQTNGKRLGEKIKKDFGINSQKVKIEKEPNIQVGPITSIFSHSNINKLEGPSMNFSKLSKNKQRYTDSDFENNSADDSFDLDDRNVETNLYERLNQSIKDFGIDENGRFVGKGSRERTVSTGDVKSYAQKSEERPMNQESTVYSKNFEKTPQKSWLMMSSDIFSVGDDEVTHKRDNNKDILNLLSESDFEQIKKAIEHDYKKNSINLSKGSHKRAFSSCVEDPKAEDADSL